MNCVILKKRASLPRNFQKGTAESSAHATFARGTILIDVKQELYDKMQRHEEVYICLQYQD